MKRLKIFAKGNVDVFDSLHACRIGGQVVWNGVNEVLRARGLGSARLRHETSTGAWGLLHPPATDGPLAACPAALVPYPLAMQASGELFATDADAIVLSILPDVAMRNFRDRETGAYVHIDEQGRLDEAASAWLSASHVMTDPPTAEETHVALREVLSRIRTHTPAPVLIYNLSPIAPGPIVHCFLGLEDSLAARIRRFNLMLIELSQETGVSIVDVESVVAKAGADRVKLDLHHLTGEGARLVAEEVVRVLEDYGVFEDTAPIDLSEGTP